MGNAYIYNKLEYFFKSLKKTYDLKINVKHKKKKLKFSYQLSSISEII